MNYLLMGLGAVLFGVGAMRQFGNKSEVKAANTVVKAAENVVKKEEPGVNVTKNPANA